MNKIKDRGTALEIFIVISFILSIYSIYSEIFRPFYIPNYLPSWYPQFLLVLRALDILGLIGIWLYKRWAIYLFVALRIISWVIGYFNLSNYQQTNAQYTWIPYMLTTIAVFILMFDGIFFWLLYRKRAFFK